MFFTSCSTIAPFNGITKIGPHSKNIMLLKLTLPDSLSTIPSQSILNNVDQLIYRTDYQFWFIILYVMCTVLSNHQFTI